MTRAKPDDPEGSILPGSGRPSRGRGAHLHLSVVGVPRGEIAAGLAAQLRGAVLDGRLHAGEQMPSTRDLAEDLGVSRGLVVDVYERLAAEGYLRAGAGRQGTTVAAVLRARRADVREVGPAEPLRAGTNPGRPDPALFPRASWGRAYGAALRSLVDSDLSYGDGRGLAELREELSRYLARSRGVAATADEIVIVNGFAQGLVCVVRWLGRSHERVRIAVEDPGSAGVVDQLRAWGVDVVHVPVDAHGLVVERLPGAGVHAVVVTPAHQYPTGVTLAPERRHALVEWAGRAGAFVIEDDYDAEHRYDRAALTSLHSLDPRRVISGGSTSKALSPALRLGWIIAPRSIADELVEIKAMLDLATATIEQAAFAELIRSGAFDRHLRATRTIYRRRRDALVAAASTLDGVIGVDGISAGFHVVLRLDDSVDEAELAAAARAAGLDARPLADFRHAPGPKGLLVGFGIATPDQLRRMVDGLRVRRGGC